MLLAPKKLLATLHPEGMAERGRGSERFAETPGPSSATRAAQAPAIIDQALAPSP